MVHSIKKCGLQNSHGAHLGYMNDGTQHDYHDTNLQITGISF